MSDAAWRHAPCPMPEAEEPRTRQQREMARLWMALNAVRQAEAAPAPPPVTGFGWPGCETEKRAAFGRPGRS